MFTIKEILLDGMKEADGAIRFPTLTWKFDTDERGFRQTAYEVQVSRTDDFGALVYTSGETASNASANVSLPVSLETACRYFVRVRAQAGDRWCAWSEPASFVSGNVERHWQAGFVSAETEADAADSKGTYVRGEISLTKPVAEAYAYTTALGLYVCSINGQRVGRDALTPGWTVYPQRLSYQTYDVTSLLHEGENALGAELGAGWFKGLMTFEHQRNFYGKRTAFFLELHVRYVDGTTAVFGTDTSWRGADSPTTFAEIYDGETYDARLEQPGWCTAGFDDSAWRPVETVKWDENTLVPQTASLVRDMGTLPVKSLLMTPKGERVLDFGQNMAGVVSFRVRGKAGTQVKLHCFEVLDAEGNVYLENLREAKETITYTKKSDEEETFCPRFTYQGFQYAWLEQWPDDAKAEDFTAHVLYSDMPEAGSFHCSNPLVNQLQHNIVWGLRSNFVEVPTDCPQRDERLGWTGDAEIFCSTANFLVNTQAFYRKWLLDLASSQAQDGAVPHVVPDILTPTATQDMIDHMGMDGASGWADAATIVPWELYCATGDRRILAQQYTSMRAWVDFMAAHTDEKGRFTYKMQFGDWLALDGDGKTPLGATPTPYTCSVYSIVSTRIMARTARILGNAVEASIFERRAENLLGHFRQNYLQDGELTVHTQTAYAMALAYDLLPEEHRAQAAAELVNLLQKDGHLVTGFMGTPCLLRALSENGQAEAAWELLLHEDFPGWLYPVKQGATTIWEHWDGRRPDGSFCSPDMNSFNHYAYGAVGDWLYRYAAGLDYDASAPGYQRILFHPCPGGGLSFAEAEHETPYGRAAIRWEREQDTYTVIMTVPPNSEAVLQLPAGAQVSADVGLQIQDGRSAAFGSGEWRVPFTLPVQKKS